MYNGELHPAYKKQMILADEKGSWGELGCPVLPSFFQYFN